MPTRTLLISEVIQSLQDLAAQVGDVSVYYSVDGNAPFAGIGRAVVVAKDEIKAVALIKSSEPEVEGFAELVAPVEEVPAAAPAEEAVPANG